MPSPETITALAALASALIWPLVVIWLVRTFRAEIRQALPRLLNESLPNLLARVRQFERTRDGTSIKFDPDKGKRLEAGSNAGYEELMKEALWDWVKKRQAEDGQQATGSKASKTARKASK